MIVRAKLVRIALLSIALGALAGCDTVSAVGSASSSVGGFFSHQNPNVASLNAGVNPRQVAGKPARNASEKMKVLPVASQDINCPEVDSPTAARRFGSADRTILPCATSSISATPRANAIPPARGQAALKIGVAGEVVIGPAGAAGTFSAPLKITVTDQGDPKAGLFADLPGRGDDGRGSAGQFRIVTDPIECRCRPSSSPTSVRSVSASRAGPAARTGHKNKKRSG